MKTKTILTGAMIFATGLSATDDGAYAFVQPLPPQPRATDRGVTFEEVKLDEDVLHLGGLARETGLFGSHDAYNGFSKNGEEYRLADQHDGTWAGGVGGVMVPGTQRLTVTNPKNNKSMTVLYDSKTNSFYNPKNGKRIKPPRWVLKQVKK